MPASICGSRSQKPRKQNSWKVKRLFTGFQTTFFDVSTNMAKYGTKVYERSRDSCRRSRDRWPIVKERFWTFQAIRKFFEKIRSSVTRQWPEVRRPSIDCRAPLVLLLPNWLNFAPAYACNKNA